MQTDGSRRRPAPNTHTSPFARGDTGFSEARSGRLPRLRCPNNLPEVHHLREGKSDPGRERRRRHSRSVPAAPQPGDCCSAAHAASRGRLPQLRGLGDPVGRSNSRTSAGLLPPGAMDAGRRSIPARVVRVFLPRRVRRLSARAEDSGAAAGRAGSVAELLRLPQHPGTGRNGVRLRLCRREIAPRDLRRVPPPPVQRGAIRAAVFVRRADHSLRVRSDRRNCHLRARTAAFPGHSHRECASAGVRSRDRVAELVDHRRDSRSRPCRAAFPSRARETSRGRRRAASRGRGPFPRPELAQLLAERGLLPGTGRQRSARHERGRDGPVRRHSLPGRGRREQ